MNRLLVVIAFAACLSLVGGTYRTGEARVLLQTAPTLGTASSFAVLGGQTVTNTGPTVVNADLGVSPGSAVTGFPPGIVVGGSIHAADALAAQAQADNTAAYNNLAGQSCDTDLTGQDLGGMTLTSGVYCFSSSAQLTGALTLDAQGDPNAVFIFQIGSTLTTASNSSVLLINGGSPCNVFWQVGSSATLGTYTTFVGNILALTSITLNTGASVSARALAQNGAVTLDTNTIGSAGCAAGTDVGTDVGTDIGEDVGTDTGTDDDQQTGDDTQQGGGDTGQTEMVTKTFQLTLYGDVPAGEGFYVQYLRQGDSPDLQEALVFCGELIEEEPEAPCEGNGTVYTVTADFEAGTTIDFEFGRHNADYTVVEEWWTGTETLATDWTNTAWYEFGGAGKGEDTQQGGAGDDGQQDGGSTDIGVDTGDIPDKLPAAGAGGLATGGSFVAAIVAALVAGLALRRR